MTQFTVKEWKDGDKLTGKQLVLLAMISKAAEGKKLGDTLPSIYSLVKKQAVGGAKLFDGNTVNGKAFISNDDISRVCAYIADGNADIVPCAFTTEHSAGKSIKIGETKKGDDKIAIRYTTECAFIMVKRSDVIITKARQAAPIDYLKRLQAAAAAALNNGISIDDIQAAINDMAAAASLAA